MRLGGRLREVHGGLSGSTAMARILSFASRVGAQADTGYSTLDLPRARSDWEAVRDEVFQPADWFRQSSAQLTESQTAKPPPIDRRLVASLKKTARDLKLLILKGRPEAEAFGEPYVDAPERSAELRRLGQRWNRWGRNWSEQLDRLGRDFPAQPPFDGDSRLLSAYNELSRAFQHLRALPYGANDSGIPFKQRRISLFEQAQHAIKEAERILSELERS